MLLDTAVFLPELCYVHYAPVGSTAPTATIIDDYDPETDPDDLGTGMTAWKHFGHSDLDEDIDSDQEGGDTDVRGTRQRPNLRTRDEPTSDYFVINGVQFSPGQLKLYHGGGTEAAGSFTVPTTRKAVEYAVLLVFVDGVRKIGEYHPRCSVKAGGAISREAENFLRMPIRFTPLAAPGNGPDTVFLSTDLFDTDGEDG